MISQRHLSRIIAMQTVFVYLNRWKINIEENLNHASTLLEHVLNNINFAKVLVEWVIENEDKLQKLVLEKLSDKNLNKIDLLTMSILFIWMYELHFDETNLAEAIIINEMVELCKQYGKEKSAPLVNAVLSTKK